jgi:hypothetical protein
MGLVVNFETGSVKGFDLIGVDPKITVKDADKIYFGVTYNDVFHNNMSGVLDRISGDLRVSFGQREASGLGTHTWQMKCRAAQRMF